MPARLTTEQFIERAKTIHGVGTYDYSEVQYITGETLVKIGCFIHGFFWQKPVIHTMGEGHGCQECAKVKQAKNLSAFMQFLTTDEFIERAQSIHGYEFDYSETTYVGYHVPIKIGCRIHGIFLQTPGSHLQKRGCRQCAVESITYTGEEFIEKANVIHGIGTYDYSLVEYENSKTKVPIICEDHGTFYQTPSDHLSERGCPQCAYELKTKYLAEYMAPLTKEEFEDHAGKVHNDKYDYTLVVFSNTKENVQIICKNHGSFWQAAYSHLRGHGCPSCGYLISKPETAWLDLLGIPKEHRQFRIKIGSKTLKVDGFDPTTNTVYEYYGDYWHGNPAVYNPNDINRENKQTFGDLYQSTLQRESLLRSQGYHLIIKWQTEPAVT